MARRLEVYQVDAFTQQPLTGNPAGVVFGAEGLDDATLLAVARELNNADTLFAFAPDGDDHDLRVRIFTPRTEAAFVGHATLALHTVLAAREGPRVRRQKGRAGIATVRPWNEGHEIRLARAPLGRKLERNEIDDVCGALGLAVDALDARCPPRIAGSGSTRLLLGVRDGLALKDLTPDSARLVALSAWIGAPGYFVFSLAPTLADCDVESRMFCPALGIAEDPVSGNAHGMLAVYLESLQLLRDGTLRGAQGHFIGRAGRLEVSLLEGADVALRGHARIVFETTITL
ncbi:MAG: PhzF family phenazine biosynthesis isomerase [Steroidobacteraceae bacterium]